MRDLRRGRHRVARRGLLRGAASTALLAALPRIAGAQDLYPTRPVTIISPFAAGGQSDVVGRLVAQHLQRVLGKPFVFENRTGAGGTLGAQYVARAAPDGYTLLFGTTGVFATSPYVYRTAGYDPTVSFAPLAMASEMPILLGASLRSGLRSVAELVAKGREHPGEVTYGSGGVGGFPHMMGEVFSSLTGVRLTHLSYRGGAPALNDLIGGQVDLIFDGISTIAPHVQEGRMRALMITGQARHPLLPDVPTVMEVGLPSLNLTSWNGFAAPAGTPAPIIATLNREINAGLASAEVRDPIKRLGVDPLGGSTDEMTARIARESAIYKRIIAEANIVIE